MPKLKWLRVDIGTVELMEVSREGWIVPPCGITVMIFPFDFGFGSGAEVFAFLTAVLFLVLVKRKSYNFYSFITCLLCYAFLFQVISCSEEL